MQQVFKTFATLLMGAMLAAGGYVAALVVPSLQAVTRGDLPSTEGLFGESPGPSAAPETNQFGAEASDWFNSFRSNAADTLDEAAADVAEESAGFTKAASQLVETPPRIVLGQSAEQDPFRTAEVSRTSFEQPGSFATTAAGVDVMQGDAARSPFSADPQTKSVPPTEPIAFASPTAFGEVTANTSANPGFGPTNTTPADSGEYFSFESGSASIDEAANAGWDEIMARLADSGATTYRLVPVEGDRLRCDVWTVDSSTGSNVKRQYSGVGLDPVAAATAALQNIRK